MGKVRKRKCGRESAEKRRKGGQGKKKTPKEKEKKRGERGDFQIEEMGGSTCFFAEDTTPPKKSIPNPVGKKNKTHHFF
ncbi:hypothetical protein, partial [Enterococcus faecium]